MVSTLTDRLYGENSGVAVKAPCIATSVGANLPLSGLAALGGYVPQEGDRILVKDQTDATQNGIYNASQSAWQRAGDFDGAYDITQGTLVVVYLQNGATQLLYQLTTPNPLIGSSPINFASYTPIAQFYPKTQPEINAGVTVVNGLLPAGYVDRYGVNLVPGTTLMLAAITAAFAQACEAGGASPVFMSVEYNVGQITNAGATLITVTGLSNCTVYGNGAVIVSDTTVSSSLGSPQIFQFVNPSNVTIDNLGCLDSGFDVTQTWKGPHFMAFTISDGTDRERVTIQNCEFQSVVSPTTFWTQGGGSGKLRGVRIIGCSYVGTYYGPLFQEFGDCADIDVTCYNPVRAYFAYGVSGHNTHVHIFHDGTSLAGSNACIDIKRYQNDTRDLKIRADYHGFIRSAYGSLVNLETNTVAGTAAITAFGAITGGAGGAQGVYWGVPLTGGSGTGASAQITVGSAGAVTAVQIMNPGKGYLATDNVSAAAANIGNCVGFSVAVSGVGGIIDGIDIDLHSTDAQIADNSNPSVMVQFRALDMGGNPLATTTDRWDRVSIRGNFGQFPQEQQATLFPINVASVQTGTPGRLALGSDLFDAFDYFNQAFPGFIVKLGANKVAYTVAGNLTAAPVFIDLSRYTNRAWALRLYVAAEDNYSTSSASQTYVEQFIQGKVSAAGVAQINNSAQVVAPQTSGTASTIAFAASGAGLNVSFTAYNGGNAYARVIVEDITKLL